MKNPVMVESGDLICINIASGTLWIEKNPDSQVGSCAPVPETPTPTKSMGKRRCPIRKILEGKKSKAAQAIAMNFAYTVAWVAGFLVGDDTEQYQPSQDNYVFKVS